MKESLICEMMMNALRRTVARGWINLRSHG